MSPSSGASSVSVNRAPVMTLWAAVAAERLGYAREEALTLGRAVAGLNAQTKGRRLGIMKRASGRGEKFEASRAATPAKASDANFVTLLGRGVTVKRTPEGLRAVNKDGGVSTAESVERYLESKFGESLADARAAMKSLAAAYAPRELEEIAFSLYEQFRPKIPPGVKGWGAAGVLDLTLIRKLAKRS